MPKLSAGILLFRQSPRGWEALLVHPGGPFWMKKDAGAWSLPKGEYRESDDPLAAARREFQEETGLPIDGTFISLGTAKSNQKVVSAWAVEGDLDPQRQYSNMFELEWPPKSGKKKEFPEIDRAEWFSLKIAREKILKYQICFLDRLIVHLEQRK